MPLPPNGKSILMTPDPYHTPGYGGFCPQFKYKIGETFGKTTCKLLADSTVASSGQLVLAEIRPTSTPGVSKSMDPKLELLRSRTHSWGDQKLVEQMVPGYTGFIPRSQHYFGNRYAVNSKGAISDFEFDSQKYRSKMAEMAMADAVQSGKVDPKAVPSLPITSFFTPIRSRYMTPLQPIAAEPQPYVSPNVAKSMGSPFYMANDNDMKRFMSGYTGFVPRARQRLGMGYPNITHHALNEFTDDTSRLKSLNLEPVTIHRQEIPIKDSKLIYPTESGLVPHYTGHIPGQKFRFGETFGNGTQDAKTKEVMLTA